MEDIDSRSPGPDQSRPTAAEQVRSRMLDLLSLAALLGLCTLVYVAVKDPGFSVIIGAVAGLFAAWRARR
jgi:hypothetical protein